MGAEGEKLLTIGEVAALFGVRPETVGKWLRQGRITCAARTLGGHRRFKQSDVQELLRSVNADDESAG